MRRHDRALSEMGVELGLRQVCEADSRAELMLYWSFKRASRDRLTDKDRTIR